MTSKSARDTCSRPDPIIPRRGFSAASSSAAFPKRSSSRVCVCVFLFSSVSLMLSLFLLP